MRRVSPILSGVDDVEVEWECYVINEIFASACTQYSMYIHMSLCT